jgi:anaerobic magnesium-protoporphyrin IX monomethyl ester cyclase
MVCPALAPMTATPRRALFIVPPTGKFIREDRCQTPIEDMRTIALRPPIDLMLAAAGCERGGAECRLIDFPAEDRDWQHLRRELADFRPDDLFLSITTPSLERDLLAAPLAKEILPGVRVFAKGAHFSAHDIDTLEKHPQLDGVLRGEYEAACEEIGQGKPLADIAGVTWRDADGKIRQNPARAFEQDLDKFPYPARHLAKNALYCRPDTGEPQTTVITNRGCPFHCIYCLANVVAGTKNRYRSVENVIGELRECVERHGIRNFLFRSDLFTQNKKWVRALCEAIRAEKLDIEWACNSRVDTIDLETAKQMQAAGCWIVAFGVESGDDESLKKMDKGGAASREKAFEAVNICRQAGLKSSVYLLMGLPWDTAESIEENIRFGQELDPDFLEIFYPYPFPGTPLYEMAVKEGLLEAGSIPPDAYSQPAIPALSLSREELSGIRRKALRRLYLRPRYIFRTLRAARSPKEFLNYVKHGALTLKDLVAGGASPKAKAS